MLTKLKPAIFCLFFLIPLLLPSGMYAQSGKKIAAFGSSVCNGTGDHLKQGGYIGRFRELMRGYNWDVVNVSRGGDNTRTINERWTKTEEPTKKPVRDDQYLIPQKPDYVIIGLSLNNEGLRTAPEDKQDSIFNKFKNGLSAIINRCEKEGFRVVVSNCYANQLFSEKHYQITKKMNIFINSLNLPGINLLGALDDGHGRWGTEFNYDDIHPSGGGHREMFFAIVPSLFDALAAGKPAPAFMKNLNAVSLKSKNTPALAFIPRDTIHSFAISFEFINQGDCILSRISGHRTIENKTEFTAKDIRREGMVLTASGDSAGSYLEIKHNELLYHPTGGGTISCGKPGKNKSHRVTLSQCLARGEMLVYIDRKKIATVPERLIPEKFLFVLNGRTAVKDLLIYRSSLNEEEVEALNSGQMIQSSLEIFSPLSDARAPDKLSLKNLAQSTESLKPGGNLLKQ